MKEVQSSTFKVKVPGTPMNLEPKKLLLFFRHRRCSLPVADIDDNVLRTDEFVFVISSAQINRSGLSGAGGFHQTKLFLIVDHREANMVDARLLGRLAFPGTRAQRQASTKNFAIPSTSVARYAICLIFAIIFSPFCSRLRLS